MQIFAIVVSLAITAVGIALFVKAIRHIIAVVKMGQPTAPRTTDPKARTVTLLKETLGHTRMLQWTAVGVGHWFVFIGFGLLFFTLLTAFGQLFEPRNRATRPDSRSWRGGAHRRSDLRQAPFGNGNPLGLCDTRPSTSLT